MQTLVSAIFMTSAFAAFVNLSAGLPGLVRARPVYYRETASRLYHPWAQLFAWLTAEVPWIAVILAVGPTISYFMIGFGEGGAVEFGTSYLALYTLGESTRIIQKRRFVVTCLRTGAVRCTTVLACVLLGATIANSLPSLLLPSSLSS